MSWQRTGIVHDVERLRQYSIEFRQSDVGQCSAEGLPGQVGRRDGPISACDVGPPLPKPPPGAIARRHFGEKDCPLDKLRKHLDENSGEWT